MGFDQLETWTGLYMYVIRIYWNVHLYMYSAMLDQINEVLRLVTKTILAFLIYVL